MWAQPILAGEAGLSDEAAESKKLACTGGCSVSGMTPPFKEHLFLQVSPHINKIPDSSVNFPSLRGKNGCIFMGREYISTEVLINKILTGLELAESAFLSFSQTGDRTIKFPPKIPCPATLHRVIQSLQDRGNVWQSWKNMIWKLGPANRAGRHGMAAVSLRLRVSLLIIPHFPYMEMMDA